ncbi:MAG: lysophospholipid acyltransferase family protein [Planctomycetes bacterium]|nr:lysophospholipid acyltransferase family protein [Planctomycetota bacterium]
MNNKSLLWGGLRLLPQPVLRATCYAFAKLHHFFDRTHAKECEDLVEAVVLPKEVSSKNVIKEMYRQIWLMLPDMVWSSKISDEDFLSHIDGVEELHAYLKGINENNQGIIFVAAHLGSWELCSQVICALSGVKPAVSLYKPHEYEWVNRLILSARLVHGQDVLSKDGGMISLFKRLKRGGNVGMVIDQHGGNSGVPSMFLGRKCKSWDSAAHLAFRTKCPLVPVSLVRTGSRYRMLWGKSIPVIENDAGKLDIQASVRLIDDQLSSFVAQYPEQWLWLGKRWGRDPKEVMGL